VQSWHIHHGKPSDNHARPLRTVGSKQDIDRHRQGLGFKGLDQGLKDHRGDFPVAASAAEWRGEPDGFRSVGASPFLRCEEWVKGCWRSCDLSKNRLYKINPRFFSEDDTLPEKSEESFPPPSAILRS
jgi:hypothetical protein